MIRAAVGATPTLPRTAPLHRHLPSGTWGREWLSTLGRPRALAMRVLVPLLLTLPLVIGGAPTFWAGMLLTVLVAMTGAVGSGITLARARSGGLLARLALVPRPAHRVLGGWVCAAAGVDFMQLLPSVIVVVAARAPTPLDTAALFVSVAAALLVTNTLGCAVAVIAGGTGEVLLDVGIVLAPLLFLGGLFTGVPADGWRRVAAAVDPFGALHSAFIAALGGSPSFASWHVLACACAWIFGSLAGLGLISRLLLDRA
jgi:hypothetical protein